MEVRDRESIRIDLSSDDEEVRRLAVERVGLLAGGEAMQCLIGCLGDPSWRVRKSAVDRIAAAPVDWNAPGFLIEALADGENPGRRNAAVEALIRCGSSAITALIEATRDSDVDVRKLVVDALAGIGDERSMSRLITMLDDPDPNVQGAAADALGMIGGSEAVPALLNAAQGVAGDRLVAFSALRALARIEAPVRARDLRMALEDSMLVPAAFLVLGRVDDREAKEALLHGLTLNSRSTREAAMEALLRLVALLPEAGKADLIAKMKEISESHPELIEDALKRLDEATLTTRLVLIQFLGMFRRKDMVVPVLLTGRDEALSEVALSTLERLGTVTEEAFDESWSTLDCSARNLACQLLGRTKGMLGLNRLVTSLEEPDAELRTIAARSLGDRCSAEALKALVHRLESSAICAEEDLECEEELTTVIDALVKIAEPRDRESPVTDEAIELLSSRIQGAAESVRLAIASVLGRIGREQDATLVEFLMKDPSASVRRAAVEALARVEPGMIPEPLRLAMADESPTVRIAAASALGASLNKAVIEDLRRLASDTNPRVRAAAVRAIARFASRSVEGDVVEESVKVLRGAMSDQGVVALAAVSGLDAIGGQRASDAAQELVEHEDPELVQAAIGCIGRHGSLGEVEGLIPLVAHEHWTVRAEVIQMLAERNVLKAVPPILRRLETEQDDFVRDAILRALKHLEE